MEIAAGAPHRFAGLGLMLARPGFVVTFAENDERERQPREKTVEQAQKEVDREIEQRIGAVVALRSTPTKVRVGLRDQLPLHSGLGGGTQLACAVAVGLELLERRFARVRVETRPDHASSKSPPAPLGEWVPASRLQLPLTAQWLVRNAGRGLRSAVGLTGFLQGGLLLDEGYVEGSTNELSERPVKASSRQLPADWRLVLVMPNRQERVFGTREAELIEELGRIPYGQSAHMLRLANRICELAQSDEGFETFAETLEQYMELGARLFSRFQRGLYNGQEVYSAVELARAAGLRGVGQSSWGPTVFGFAASERQANQSAQCLRDARPDWWVITTEPASSGAEVRWLR